MTIVRNMLVILGLGAATGSNAQTKAPAKTGAAAAKPAADAPTAAAQAAAPEKKIRYRKTQNIDLSSQTIEGKLQRPEASLVTASEGVNDNGLLRLREDFLDKFTTFAGEEIQQ